MKKCPDAGIFTSEGVVSGSRALELAKEREKEHQAFQEKKKAISEARAAKVAAVNRKFASQTISTEDAFKTATIGLCTREEFIAAKNRTTTLCGVPKEEVVVEASPSPTPKKQRKKKKRDRAAVLSFEEDDEGEDSFPVKKRPRKVGKDPTVDTSFLPDRQREVRRQEQMEQHQREWLHQQELLKQDDLNVTYSYWDGVGHRRTTVVKKGMTIRRFLERCREELCSEFPDLVRTPADNLMFVKEDTIIPHRFSFYDLIISKARGKAGRPLFLFDIVHDVRMVIDCRVKKDESHAAKIVHRHWYETNKHIFPANGWITFDPHKKKE